MRAFIVLALIALARADVGGYNYQSAGGSQLGGSSGFGGSSNLGGSSGFGGSSNLGGSSGFGGSSNIGGSSGFGGSSNLGGSSNQGGSHSAPAEVEKEFYTFTAPEGEFDDGAALKDLAPSAKKNLQVIFIRGPENNGLSDAALNLAKSAIDSKTAIYVLTKQSDASDLADKLKNQNNHNAQKPEVHFVKYRTDADAQHAQQAIQSQYDQLGGSSQSHNGGVAPVLDFASKAQHNGGSAAAPSNSYVPPKAPSSVYLPIFKH